MMLDKFRRQLRRAALIDAAARLAANPFKLLTPNGRRQIQQNFRSALAAGASGLIVREPEQTSSNPQDISRS